MRRYLKPQAAMGAVFAVLLGAGMLWAGPQNKAEPQTPPLDTRPGFSTRLLAGAWTLNVLRITAVAASGEIVRPKAVFEAAKNKSSLRYMCFSPPLRIEYGKPLHDRDASSGRWEFTLGSMY